MKPIKLFFKWQNGQIFGSKLGTCIVLDCENFICWSAGTDTLFKIVDGNEDLFVAKAIAQMPNEFMKEALNCLRRHAISVPIVNIETV